MQFGFLIKGNKDFENFWECLKNLNNILESDDLFISAVEYKNLEVEMDVNSTFI